jgi:arylsulfatase A-like enzyme
MPPNILHISTHDSGRWFGCYGHPTVETPHIDQLAAEGTRLTNYFAVSPICSPSRGAAMTGLQPQRNGLLGLTHHGFSLNDNVRHAAELLADSGYQSVLFSFQHETVMENWRRLGFEDYLCPEIPDQPYPDMFHTAPEVAETFADFLNTRDISRPFYAQVGFNETHTPFDFGGAEPRRDRGVDMPAYLVNDEKAEAHLAALQGALKQADDGVGVLLDALDRVGLTDNTLVIFTTDHGIECNRDKWTLYDPGLEIACLFRGPGIPSGAELHDLKSNIDFLPTLLELVGLPVPQGLDGRSFAPRFRTPEGPAENLAILGTYYNGACRCIRTSRYKLIWNLGPEPYVADPPVRADGSSTPKHARPIRELYDLQADPDEFQNLAGQPELREVEETLAHDLHRELVRLRDPSLCV